MKFSLSPLRLLLFTLACLSGIRAEGAAVSFDSPNGYQSPYRFQFMNPEATRTAGWDAAPWSTPERWGILPRDRWYDREAYRLRSFENLAYGAQPIHFPPPGRKMDPALRRERVLTAGEQLIGMRYQHHHIPIFDPYRTRPEWPWIRVVNGIRGPGLDCSNFVAWVYNYALGIKLSGSVVEASRQTTVSGPRGKAWQIHSFEKDPNMSFEAFVAQLQPGDVLYIQSKKGNISHSILWVGTLAVDSNGKDKYFILDSTGPEIVDSNGVHIPDGAHIRPFRPNSWYFRSAKIVYRIIPDQS